MIHSLFQPFTSEQFHALLNSLFKVLFNFPSRYLFAIGFVAIFSLRWSLPPTLSCTHKQLDSRESSTHCQMTTIQASHPLWAKEAAFQRTWAVLLTAGNEPPKHHIPKCPYRTKGSVLGSSLFARRYWGNHFYFLFLRLMICLNSAGNPVQSEVIVKSFDQVASTSKVYHAIGQCFAIRGYPIVLKPLPKFRQ